MSEARLLALVARYPDPTALARRARSGSIFPALHRLEARGLVRRQRGAYRLTRSGRDELALTRALARLVARARPARAAHGTG
jgi:DNA-binding PadR family transcriptional regulator